MSDNFNQNKLEIIPLSNGLAVILLHMPSTVCSTYWWVNTGSADESPEQAGYAHFLEHMLFKDASAKENQKPSTGKTARMIESLGGDMNAYTTFDHTVFHVTCAAIHWKKILPPFLGLAKPQRFLALDFEREREVILEEYRKNQDSASRMLFETLFKQTFQQHPYGNPIIGTLSSLKKATLSKLENFYKAHYIPSRMALILAGPMHSPKEKAELLSLLEKNIGYAILPSSSKKKLGLERKAENPIKKTACWSTHSFDIQSSSAALSFRVPDIAHEDNAALELIAGILGMGESSRLYQRLFYKESLVTGISASLYIPKDPGILYITWDTEKSENLLLCLQSILEEIETLKTTLCDPSELSRIITNISSDRIYARQTVDGAASHIGQCAFVMSDLQFDENYLQQLNHIQREDIQRIAKKYLCPSRLSGVVLTPKTEPKLTKQPFQALCEKNLTFSDKKEIKGSFKPHEKSDTPLFLTLKNGTKIIYHYRPSHLFSLHLTLLGGSRLESFFGIRSPEEDHGISSLMASTWTKGTPQLSSQHIAEMIESHAAQLDGFSGRNSCGLHLVGLSKDWAPLKDLFLDVLLHPTFPELEINHNQRIALDALRSVYENSASLCSQLFLETLFETHPYGKPTVGTQKSIMGIGQTHLKALHLKWSSHQPFVMSIFGALHKNELMPFLEDFDDRHPSTPSTTLNKHIPSEKALQKNRFQEKKLDREQCHIIVGGIGLTLKDPQRFALALLETLMGGQSGRLFIELREKQSLAYTVSPLHFEGLENGFVGTYIACAHNKKQQALEGITRLFENFIKKGPTPAELIRAKEFYLGRLAMELQTDSALSSYHGLNTLYEIPYQSMTTIRQKIHQVSATEIQTICRKLFVDTFLTTVIVG